MIWIGRLGCFLSLDLTVIKWGLYLGILVGRLWCKLGLQRGLVGLALLKIRPSLKTNHD